MVLQPVIRLEGRDHERVLGPVARRRLAGRVAPLERGPTVSPEALGSLDPGTVEVITSIGALCTVDDVEGLLEGVRKALVPHGQLRFVEHVGRVGPAGRLLSLVDPVWARLSFGCHVDRDVTGALRRAGFRVHSLERFTLPTPVVLLRRWVGGVAAPAAG